MFKIKIIFFKGDDKDVKEDVIFNGVIDVPDIQVGRSNCIEFAFDAHRESKNFIIKSVTGPVNIKQSFFEQEGINITLYRHVDALEKIVKGCGIRLEMTKLDSGKHRQFHAFTRAVDTEELETMTNELDYEEVADDIEEEE